MSTTIADFDALERRAVEAAMIYRYGQLVDLKDAEVELKLVPGKDDLTPVPAYYWNERDVQFVVCKTGEQALSLLLLLSRRRAVPHRRTGLRRPRRLRAQPAAVADRPRHRAQGAAVPEEPGQGRRHGRGVSRSDHHLRFAMTLDKARQAARDPGRLRRLLQLQRRQADPRRSAARARTGRGRSTDREAAAGRDLRLRPGHGVQGQPHRQEQVLLILERRRPRRARRGASHTIPLIR